MQLICVATEFLIWERSCALFVVMGLLLVQKRVIKVPTMVFQATVVQPTVPLRGLHYLLEALLL
jgi:hypothetical protein